MLVEELQALKEFFYFLVLVSLYQPLVLASAHLPSPMAVVSRCAVEATTTLPGHTVINFMLFILMIQ